MTTAIQTRNSHQRKLAVMAKCDAIVPDKEHPAHHFPFISIQNISSHLRRFCVEEGLDPVLSVEDGVVIVELVNADDPADRIVSRWPAVEGDKGYAYSVKFPLVRLFLIGDGEENDEAEMAAAKPQKAAAGKPKWAVTKLGRNCLECGDGDLQLRVSPDAKQRFIGCSNWPDNKGGCKYREAPPPATPAAVDVDYLGMLTRLNAGEQKAIALDPRFARNHGDDGWTETRDEWIARLNAAQLAMLRAVLDAKLADEAIPS